MQKRELIDPGKLRGTGFQSFRAKFQRRGKCRNQAACPGLSERRMNTDNLEELR